MLKLLQMNLILDSYGSDMVRFEDETKKEWFQNNLNQVIMDLPVNPNLTVTVPLVVRKAILMKFLYDLETGQDILKKLVWTNLGKHFFFNHSDMYFGVETDGYIHT